MYLCLLVSELNYSKQKFEHSVFVMPCPENIYFELTLVFFYISTQETHLLVQKCSDSQLFLLLESLLTQKLKTALCLMQEQL